MNVTEHIKDIQNININSTSFGGKSVLNNKEIYFTCLNIKFENDSSLGIFFKTEDEFNVFIEKILQSQKEIFKY